MPAPRHVIDYANSFHFDASPSVVWSALENPEQFERWWAWLDSLTVEGDGLHAGSIWRGTVTPPLPYRMRVEVAILRCVPEGAVDAEVHGDLEGVARLGLCPDGEGTRAEVAWTIEMRQRPMRAAARFAHPLLRWGHDMVVDATVRAFRAHVRELNARGGA